MTPLEKALDRLANGHYLKSMEEMPSDDCRFSIVTVTFVDDEKFTFPSCVLPEYIINNIQFYHKLRKIYQYEAIGKLNDFLQDRFADYPVEPFIKDMEAPNEH